MFLISTRSVSTRRPRPDHSSTAGAPTMCPPSMRCTRDIGHMTGSYRPAGLRMTGSQQNQLGKLQKQGEERDVSYKGYEEKGVYFCDGCFYVCDALG